MCLSGRNQESAVGQAGSRRSGRSADTLSTDIDRGTRNANARTDATLADVDPNAGEKCKRLPETKCHTTNLKIPSQLSRARCFAPQPNREAEIIGREGKKRKSDWVRREPTEFHTQLIDHEHSDQP